jgi:hypothetical protein
MGHKLRGSQGNYYDFHDVIETARKYIASDWSAGEHSKLNGLTRQVSDQEEMIKTLQAELEHYKLRDKKVEGKADVLEKLLKRVEKLEKRLG